VSAASAMGLAGVLVSVSTAVFVVATIVADRDQVAAEDGSRRRRAECGA